ncbi:alpha/beta hydrolase [Candidatus Viridilinea mediisalina]|uniref:Phospholipase n=1 Tax=Candidatus Viridilinea mediisalina TaxID=2024553 RepID=A0A2A6RL43_9CHLR|nr:alpha/beta hydrolase-fold protein [Candidatus Viridilinea mediisalina]PDW03797.1 phospholipase [Candidatus Viridilinea mediisalina]
MTTIHTVERKPREASERPPLLLLLHGYGANEHDLFDLADYFAPELYVVSARAPLALPWGGFAWYHLGGVPGRLIPDKPSRAAALELVERFIPSLPERLGTDPQRTYVLGFSQGAIMSLAFAMRRPDTVAGIMALSGYLDPELTPSDLPAALDGLPIIQMHGTYDDVIPVSAAHMTRDALEKLPVQHVYHEYPIGHGIHPEGVRVLQAWMAERA